MNTNLLFDFTVDKEKKTIFVKREFLAEPTLVWDAWTQAEILDQWWAPKPFKAETVSMDFSEGGHWHYVMAGPNGERHHCKAFYLRIDPISMFTFKDAFCNDKGEPQPNMPTMHWTNNFYAAKENTLVDIVVKFETLDDLEKIIQMGFKEGFTAGLENLDQYIASQFQLRKQNKTSNMARVSTYLNFPGNTETAFKFYKSVFKTEFINGIKRFGELPPDPNQPPIAEPVKKMVLHVELPTIGGHILMGSDAPKEMGFTVVEGNNVHINLEPESRAEAKRLFDALAAGGKITMPIQDMFWGAYYGSCTDQFGINWMVNYQVK
ncbi:MAG: activator of Hsp90 ATPase 1 family protein [Bacteroidetes bacterium OLB12]|nr:MAG: activator of Hsp90 ATPase 1 family protein [Bacteroidetes bacterium OLB12]HNU42673.1 SRPBCC domain-containing protein [Cyclobacteriaceae bacterium]